MNFRFNPCFILPLAASLAIPARAQDQIQNARRAVISLNGEWQYARVPAPDSPPPASGWQNVQVPSTIGGENYEQAWFRRSFTPPSNWRAGRVLVRFGGVKWDSQVLVNGQLAGGRFNGYDAFELDITPFLRDGENQLAVRARDWTATFSEGPKIDMAAAASQGLGARGAPKARVIAPFGGLMSVFGIWDDVDLVLVPNVRVEDGWIQPRLSENRLQIDLTLRNQASSTWSGALGARIFHAGRGRGEDGQWNIQGAPVASLTQNTQVSPNTEGQATLRFDRPGLAEWTPESPNLYVLEVSLPDGERWRERFGWREMRAQGPNFLLNGRVRHLLASSWWPTPNPLGREEIVRQLRGLRKANTWTFRTHTQPWPRRWYEAADEEGVMMIPEAALWCDPGAYAFEDERFWKNYADHVQAMARSLRNHPSIIMYSLENELRHCLGDSPRAPLLEAGLVRMASAIRQVDSKPLTFEADGDPGSTPTSGGATDVIGIHYPNEYPGKRLWPNDAYWMNDPRKLSMFWKGNSPFLWDRKKPVYIGEYLWIGENSSPAPHTVFFGDEAYRDFLGYSARAKAESWKMQILALRSYGANGSPWTMNENGPLDEHNPTWLAHQQMYRPLAAFSHDYDSRFWAGESITRRVEVFNDTGRDLPSVTLRSIVLLGGNARPIAQHDRKLSLKSGEHQQFTLPISLPHLSAPSKAKWSLQVLATPLQPSVQDYEWSITPRPSAPLAASASAPIVDVFDPSGVVRSALLKLGRRTRELKSISDWDGRNVLVVGPQVLEATRSTSSDTGSGGPGAGAVANGGNAGAVASTSSASREPQIIGGGGGEKAALAAKVEAGGRVVVIESEARPWLPVRLSDQDSTMTFAQATGHPILEGLSPSDFKFWRGDNLVSRGEAERAAGALRPLVVSGTALGVSHAPLAELSQGRGLWILCGLRVASKFDSEPIARTLLTRMLSYAQSYQAPPGETRVVAPSALQTQLKDLGLDAAPLGNWSELNFPQVGLLIFSGDNVLLQAHGAEVSKYLQAGGRLLWHRPQAEGFEAASKALGLSVERRAYEGPASRADELPARFSSLLREDLYWLGGAPQISWNAAPLASVAEAVFEQLNDFAGARTFQATANPTLEGTFVSVTPDKKEVGLFTNGSATYDVDFASAGRQAGRVWARGSIAQGELPQFAVRLDGRRVGVVTLQKAELAPYEIAFQAPAGKAKLSFEFINDASGNGEDRNLWLQRFELAAQNSSGTLELASPPVLVSRRVGAGEAILSGVKWDQAASNAARAQRFEGGMLSALGARFRPTENTDAIEVARFQEQPGLPWFHRENSGVYMGAGGWIEGRVRVLKAGRYRVRALGKGTSGIGIFPIIALSVDGQEQTRIEIKSDNFSWHEGTVNLPEGEHTLRITFTNDNAPAPEDRNLWLDRLEFSSAP